MKKLLCFMTVMATFISIQAQTVISNFVNSHSESFKIVLLTKDDKPYRVSIDCETGEKSNGEIWIKPTEVAKFRDALVVLKEKFEEWDATAKDNNVTKASKEMPVKFPKVEFVWGRTTTFFANASFKAKWVLSSPVEVVICFATVKATNNRFAEEMFTIRFYSIDDVQALIDALSQDKIDAALHATENLNLFQ